MDEDELEQAMRDGLQRRVAEADVAERPGPLVARAREAARSGRRTRTWVAGLAAASVAAAAVVGAQVARDDEPAPQVSDGSTSPSPSVSATPAPEPVGNTRTEYYRGVQVDVPADWGWGSSPVLCGVTPIGEPYVGRPIPATDACGPAVFDAVPTAPYVWLGADVATGSVDLGEGWIQETVAVDGTTVTVATQEARQRNAILGSAATQDLCPAVLVGTPGPTYENTVEGLGAFVDAEVCAYRRGGPANLELVYAAKLTGGEAETTFVAVADAAPIEGDLDCGNDEVVTVAARYRDDFGPPEVLLNRSAVFVFGGCGVIDRGAFDQEVTTHRVTEASVRPWASDGALRHILTGPFDQWAYEYFIGVQG